MITFCTLFDSAYLSRGLAMYESLCRYCSDFQLFVFAFDDRCYEFLQRKNFENIIPVSLREFEDEELLSVKKNRTSGEYCWTCTSSTILYVLNHYNVESCTYIDADIFFFASPQILIDEVGDDSILITEHRYTEKYDLTTTSGKYCVQFMFFRNDRRARTALNWWRESCLKWCYNRIEDGKFGDQKYVDDWCERFEGVHELQHLGGGVAPWNMQQYLFTKSHGQIFGIEIVTGKKFEVVFFHFHALIFLSSVFFSFSPYYEKNSNIIYRYLFIPYVTSILRIRRKYSYIMKSEQYGKKINGLKYPLYEKLCCIWSFCAAKSKMVKVKRSK